MRPHLLLQPVEDDGGPGQAEVEDQKDDLPVEYDLRLGEFVWVGREVREGVSSLRYHAGV